MSGQQSGKGGQGSSFSRQGFGMQPGMQQGYGMNPMMPFGGYGGGIGGSFGGYGSGGASNRNFVPAPTYQQAAPPPPTQPSYQPSYQQPQYSTTPGYTFDQMYADRFGSGYYGQQQANPNAGVSYLNPTGMTGQYTKPGTGFFGY